MRAKIERTEKGVVLVSDEPLFAGIDDGAEVEVSTDGGTFVITALHHAELRQVLDEMDEQYSDVFRRLAQ